MVSLQVIAGLFGIRLADYVTDNDYRKSVMKHLIPSLKLSTVAQSSVAAFALLLVSFSASADSLEAGKTKAVSCIVCHGANGISQMPGAPNLAGQQAIYTMEQLKNFRSGKRTNEIMNVIAKPLSDADISDLAAWFESIKNDPVSH